MNDDLDGDVEQARRQELRETLVSASLPRGNGEAVADGAPVR